MDSGFREFGITRDRTSLHVFDLVELLIQHHQLRGMGFQIAFVDPENIKDLLVNSGEELLQL